MSNAAVFDMPMELSLEFVPVVGSYFPNTKRELGNNGIDEIDRI